MPLKFYKYALQAKERSLNKRILSVNSPTSLCFANNDYLCLSSHPLIKEAWIKGVELYRIGATGSRLLSGNHEFIVNFESQIASDKNQKAALVFNTGFQANVTILATLLNKQILGHEPLVFSDRLNHASMHAGCQLAGVRQQRYQHLDLNHLETLLQKERHSLKAKFILTESIFGMDGDQADLESLSVLAEKYQAFLYVDEAHATGVFGKRGYGIASETTGRIHGVMGTFSKALGLAGAYFASDDIIKDYLVNFAQGFIYSTTLPFPLLYAANQAWNLIENMTQERLYLQQLSTSLHQKLAKIDITTTPSTSHIVGIVFDSVSKTLSAAKYLETQGINVSAIRPPTVPAKASRLRIALRISHTQDDIAFLIDHLSRIII